MSRSNRNDDKPEKVTIDRVITESVDEKQDVIKAAIRDVRTVSYNSDNPLEIPQEIKDRFAGEGYALRWTRLFTSGIADNKNITTRLNRGYTFVTQGEVPEMVNFNLGTSNKGEDDIVMLDDLGLTKISFENLDKSRAKAKEKTAHQQEAIRSERKNMEYVKDSSTSSVSGGGRRRNFAPDKG